MEGIKKDKEIARLKRSDLVRSCGIYINYVYQPEYPGKVRVAIRVGRCHRKAVERNRIRRWIKEILRAWVKEDPLNGEIGLDLLINVGIKECPVSFSYLRDVLRRLLDLIVKRYVEHNKVAG